MLEHSTLKSTVEQFNSWHTGVICLASSEQTRKVTDRRRERRWEMTELKDHQRQEMEHNVPHT